MKPASERKMSDFRRREIGGISPHDFSNRCFESEVLHLEIGRKLESHEGCVRTVGFNAKGDILISGGYDTNVILWDWDLGDVKLFFDSGHSEDIYQAKFMPHSDDRTIVTCGEDRMVRRAKILEGGNVETSVLGWHERQACGLCIEPENPHIFYTCGHDGLVQRFDLRSHETPKQLFKCESVMWRNKAVKLNTISIHPMYKNNLAVGGIDDKYARIYDVRSLQAGLNGFTPATTHFSHPGVCEQIGITDLAFSEQSELVVSYRCDSIYSFKHDIGLGSNPDPTSVSSSSSPNDDSIPLVYKGHKNHDATKRVNFFGPRCEYVVSGSDCGRIFIWRKKTGELVRVMKSDKVNCIASHPDFPVLASGGDESDVKVWTPTAAERATIPDKDMFSSVFWPKKDGEESVDEDEVDDLLDIDESESESESEDEEEDGDGDEDEQGSM